MFQLVYCFPKTDKQTFVFKALLFYTRAHSASPVTILLENLPHLGLGKKINK